MAKPYEQESQGSSLSEPLCSLMTLGKCISFSLGERKVTVPSPPLQSCWQMWRRLWRALSFPEKSTMFLSPLLCGALRLWWLELHSCTCQSSSLMLPVSPTACKQISIIFPTQAAFQWVRVDSLPIPLSLASWIDCVAKWVLFMAGQPQPRCCPAQWPWSCY